MTSIGSPSANTSVTIGIRIPKVPHDVPVEKAKKAPTRNKTDGRMANENEN